MWQAHIGCDVAKLLAHLIPIGKKKKEKGKKPKMTFIVSKKLTLWGVSCLGWG